MENSLGKQIDEYDVCVATITLKITLLTIFKIDKDQAMILHDRVSEAQREAIMAMKDYDERKGNKPGKKSGFGKRSRDQMDQEEG